jgi:hypothetical protein
VALAKPAKLNSTAHTGRPTTFYAHETFPHQSRPPNFNPPKKNPPTFPHCRCSAGPTTPYRGPPCGAQPSWPPAELLLCTNPGNKDADTWGPHAPSPPQSVKPQAAHASPSLRPALRAPDQNPNQPTTADDELAARRSRDELPRCALWRGGRGPNSSDRVSSSPRRHRCRVPASRF